MKNTTAVGNRAEELACEYLSGKGFRIVERNYKDRFCEIDIVAASKEFVVFAEVKYRARADFGGALGAVSASKYRRMARSAEFWLMHHPEFTQQPRLDVVAITGDLTQPTLEHLENVVE